MSFEQEFNLKANNGKIYKLKIYDYGDGTVVSNILSVESKLKNNLDDLKHSYNKMESMHDIANQIDIDSLLNYLKYNADTLEEIFKKLDT